MHFGGGATASSFLYRWWLGSFADIAMFKAALTPDEVAQLHNQPVAYFAGQTKSNSVHLSVLSPLESWRAENFGSTTNNDDGDDDGDGLTNLQEYVMGTDPKTGNTEQMTPALTDGTMKFNFTAKKADGMAYDGLTRRYTLEYVTDLSDTNGWTAVPGYTDITGDNQAVQVSLPTDGVRRFYRLKVTLAP